MNLLRKNNTADYTSSAKVVDGNLILSLPDAINPVVWRMELGSVKASALEVRPHTDGTFLLSLKTPKGEVHDIAPFTTRESAITALMRVSAAMQGAQGRMSPFTSPATAPQTHAQPASSDRKGGGLKWIGALAAVIIVIVLFAYLSSLAPVTQAGAGTVESATSLTGEPHVESGVPQSADQVLRGGY
ncbi:MAG: hypothetical protein DI551_04835 [Micavibrio aeruginosavorus]|uniref:Uncharacterized protein n=1 Tax=Micavibrio aeruginosavorus TaxID=349221 RepID=A0A2W5N1Y1_9BACT|nr:MAG: hypothetical protein DI551_04835 [Micavibrio aeruginosavorus]